ncbi:glutathione S-transferase [Sinimarinibacterium sp. CAU 1509]|uniref:glutathione S-transferase n=1 Tax=Sinimarinibacterium sp. CAU 1509 TaxID=2562283 RepID=UPI0010AD492A|nr:glutathione S-transferase family protein [Sinimarinibacterium sp. CAU 1509]TJY58881.1 glutathione S-transferase [Sinimarinibacterium sp. CAU 1509]
MPALTLTYFDFDGGRGEPARLALHIGGVPFEDRRVLFKEWQAMRDGMPFRALPVLEVDGRLVAQSNSINRYVGKLAGLYPQDNLQALLCDEVMDAVEDMDFQIGSTIGLDAEAKKKAREALTAGPLPHYLEQFQARLEAAGGEYFADRRLTVGDLKVWMLVRWLRSGMLDDIPKDLVDRVAPRLVTHAERLAAQPQIAAYYAGRKKA